MPDTKNFPAQALDSRGLTKAQRRCWGSVTVTVPGAYRVLVEFPDRHTEVVATVAFNPAAKCQGVLRVRAYADEVSTEKSEPVVGPGGD